jgi:ribosomal protein S4
MQRKSLAKKIEETRELLQANDKQMARHLRMSLGDYEAIKSGARVLPLPAQKTLERRLEGLLERCGLESLK